MSWHVDEGLAVLIAQWKARHPGAVVGTIAGAGHVATWPATDHAPEPAGAAPGQDAGEIDGGDFMPGNGVTMADLAELRAALLEARDARLLYVIFKSTIVSSVVDPWRERTYRGAYHGHLHVSVNDRFDRNTSAWDLEASMPRTYVYDALSGRMPQLQVGDEDQPNRTAYLWRVQLLLGVEPDGVYGPITAAALRQRMAGQSSYKPTSTNGGKIREPEWRVLLGLW